MCVKLVRQNCKRSRSSINQHLVEFRIQAPPLISTHSVHCEHPRGVDIRENISACHCHSRREQFQNSIELALSLSGFDAPHPIAPRPVQAEMHVLQQSRGDEFSRACHYPRLPFDLTPRAAFARLKDTACRSLDLKSKSRAEVAELADAHGSGPCTRKGVGVRVPSSAPNRHKQIRSIIPTEISLVPHDSSLATYWPNWRLEPGSNHSARNRCFSWPQRTKGFRTNDRLRGNCRIPDQSSRSS
jgi:hypothetical protein